MALFFILRKYRHNRALYGAEVSALYYIKVVIDMFLENYGFSKQFEKNEFKIDSSIKYWCNMLFEKIVRIFSWEGLPADIPQREIETRLVLNGFCGRVRDG